MGRRSINTTKSGKYMNPTDQARKEARKKELKKNKRQRQMVRAAVLKMKDPEQILEELEKIDEMEYNVLQPPPLNEKVLKEKRKKLKETFYRVLKMYDKDDPEKWVELKSQEMEYEKRRAHLISYFESVKHAQSVQVDEIPLPTLQVPENLIHGSVPTQIPLPMDPILPKPILKKDSVYKEKPSGLEPPGVPPGPPPDFMQLLMQADLENPTKKAIRFADVPEEEVAVPGVDEREISEEVQEEATEVEAVLGGAIESAGVEAGKVAPKPTSLQQRMLALSGQNIDEFMREMEEVHKKRERDRAADLNARLSALKKRDRHASDSDSDDGGDRRTEEAGACVLEPPGTEEPRAAPAALGPAPAPAPTLALAPNHAPPVLLHPMPPPLMPPGFRAPPLRMGLGVGGLRLPPGAPPGVPPGVPPGPPPGVPMVRLGPPGPPPGLPPRAMLRMPPGPPPGAPPRLLRPPGPLGPPAPLSALSALQTAPGTAPAPAPAPVLSAAPQLINKKDTNTTQGATISAKPQIRNLSADVTRFVPSALRVKREGREGAGARKARGAAGPQGVSRPAHQPAPPTKDDAYSQFMKEMQGLL